MSFAASEGTRLFPLPGEGMKFAAPVLGPPISRHILDLLARRYATAEASADFR